MFTHPLTSLMMVAGQAGINGTTGKIRIIRIIRKSCCLVPSPELWLTSSLFAGTVCQSTSGEFSGVGSLLSGVLFLHRFCGT